ncbi:uncharacterized protein F4812DRAFT_412809 [Daldinia caldariorum]|uniref:uncharacterized protein n=1 Tax=Daldinia caldariorum TaxID=326644 RepID=UPI0020084647|nr:uncharacterized protein F4812DRAFT_412809 [Daldinia caldariorum]KAI1471111.1 hypothetical protein F4812DRAFT_412809 [Daldinia caldariorum]
MQLAITNHELSILSQRKVYLRRSTISLIIVQVHAVSWRQKFQPSCKFISFSRILLFLVIARLLSSRSYQAKGETSNAVKSRCMKRNCQEYAMGRGEHSRCRAHADERNEAHRQKLKKLQAAGLCYDCEGRAMDGDIRCKRHCILKKMQSTARSKTFYYKQKAMGKCVSCQSQAKEGFIYCERHYIAKQVWNRKKAQEKAKLKQQLTGEELPSEGEESKVEKSEVEEHSISGQPSKLPTPEIGYEEAEAAKLLLYFHKNLTTYLGR